MTRKHFKELALILGVNSTRNDVAEQQLVKDITSWCKRENSRFDKERFLNAVSDARRAANP